MKTWITLATLLASSSVYAAEVVTLADGREVKLNDDFTWEYVMKNAQKPVKKQTVTTSPVKAAPAIASIPLVTKSVGTTIVVNAKKPTLQLSDSGVDVLIGSASYEGGNLILPTAITNQSSQSVIQIEVEVQVFDMSGKALTQEKIIVWQSIKRMADTYLRPQQAEQGKTIRLAVPKSQQYRFSAKVVEVQTR